MLAACSKPMSADDPGSSGPGGGIPSGVNPHHFPSAVGGAP